jgi:HEAT repeat protein
VFTTDLALTIRTWDAWLSRATGIREDVARGRPLGDVVPDLSARGLLAPFEQVLSRGTVEILAPAFHQFLIPCPPGTPSAVFERMQQRVTIGPLREDGRIVGTMVTIEDVTARVERERELSSRLSSLNPDVRLEAARRLADTEPIADGDPLMSVMGDEDWRVRRAAVTALRTRKTAATIAAVLQALRGDHRNFSVLSSAVELLAASDVDVIEPLIALLRSADADLRLQAALVLGDRGDRRAIEPLMEVLHDPDENLRFHAIEALGKLKAATAVEPLLSLAEGGDFFLAFPALEALARIGDATVAPRLVPLLADDLLRGAVTEVLGSLGDEDVVEPLTRLLNDAAAPTEVIAEALALVFDRYQEQYQEGEYIVQLVRGTIAPGGTQSLLDAVQRAGGEHLRPIARVLGWLEGPAVQRALTRLLGQPSVRAKAVESLVRHGGRVVELLVEQLAAEDLETRHAAVVGLGRIGDRRATPALVDVLARDPALTVVTAGALARIGDARAFEPLLGLIGHPDAAVRHAVIAALNSIGHADMAHRITPLLNDPHPQVRESAVRIAGYFGYAECAGALLERCHDPDPSVRRAALEHLAFLEDERVLSTLLDAMDAVEPVMRAAAVQSLSRLDADPAARRLVSAASDSDPWVRYFAARALGERRPPGAVDALARLALDDEAEHVRLAAIEALGRMGEASAVPVLAALSVSDERERSTAALRALGNFPHRDVWPPLQAALRRTAPEERTAAIEAVARLGGREAVELLEWMAAADDHSTVVEAAVRGLATMCSNGSSADPAVSALVGVTADEARRPMAIAALAALPPSCIEQVAHGLRDPRAGVRAAVLQALGRMRRTEASRWLQVALDDGIPEVRLAAITELRRLGTSGVDRRLLTLARTDPHPVIRRAALAALRGTGTPSEMIDNAPGPMPGVER